MIVNQVTTLSVLMEKRSGLLSQVVRTLIKRGHIPQGQQSADSDQPGHTVLSVYFKDEILLGADDLSAIKNIHPAIREIKIEHPRAAAALARKFGPRRPIPEADFFSFLLKHYPNIVHLVIEYKKSLNAPRRSKSIFSLGQNFGIREYRLKYSRGNPLALDLTIKRMLQPALSPLVAVDVSANSISVDNCPFCREYISSDNWQCEFLRGFILGFLKENPKTPSVAVHQSLSVARGDDVCHFEIT